MAKNSNFLVATDSRFPLTVALADAFAANALSPDLLTLRKRELVELVSEAAKTFGFQSKTTLTSALDMSIGLLSLALVSSTKGASIPGEWSELLVAKSWKTLVKEAIGLVREVKQQDEGYDHLFESEKDPRLLRDHLRDFALSRDGHQQWVGYDRFARYQEERHHLQKMDTLIRWLIKSLVKRPLYWMKDPIEGPSCADEALNTILFRECTGLGFNQKDILLTEKDFRRVRTEYEDAPREWPGAVQKRYDALVKTIPADLQEAIDASWIQKRFAKGPPKVKKWDAMDMPGITGFYYYQAYL